MERNKNEIKENKRKSPKKIIKIIASVLLVILIITGILAGSVFMTIDNKLNKIQYVVEPDTTIPADQEFVFDEDEEIIEIELTGDATGQSMQEIIKNWILNEAPKMSNETVLNFLLIGSDALKEDPNRANSMERGNTDAMMIVSIDTKNKTVKMVSIMRDSYMYMQQFDKFAKLNAACANGGPAYLVETIEDAFKIEIDGYVMVDFKSFTNIINILGGIEIDVPKYVADYLTKDSGKTFPSGKCTLNGEQALLYSRVRKSDKDGDISRVSRQREVINSIINKAKNASLTEINNIMNVVLENVKTNVSKDQVVDYAKKAIIDNWANFEISQLTLPDQHTRCAYSSRSTAWIWIVDYPLAAQTLQKFLYNETNISLPEDRETAITIMGKKPS